MMCFEDWVALGLNEEDPPEEIPRETLAGYFIRFNLEIGRIRADWSDEALARGIWHLYGSGACLFTELHRLPPSPLVQELFASVTVLYRDLFEARCSHFYAHLDWGPVPEQPLNVPCYMLWDMDCGVNSFWLSGIPEYVALSVGTLERLGRSGHPAVIESVIHGLGHIAEVHEAACRPILEEILNRDEIPGELRQYAWDAIHSCIN